MKRQLLIISILCIATSITPMQRARTLTRPYKPTFIQNKPLYEEINSRKCNNLIMILDPLHQESAPEGKKFTNLAGLISFYAALRAQNSPILATKNILQHFCIMAINHQNDVPLDTTFTSNNWHCIAHKDADLILLIPKNYIEPKVRSLPVIEQINSCGFKINSIDFDVIKDLSTRNLLNSTNMTINNYADIVDAIKNLFSITDLTDNNSPSWNMCISGHGKPSHTKKTLNDRVESLIKSKSLQLDENNYKEKVIKQDLKLLHEAQHSADDTIIPDSGQTAGLMTNDFLDLFSFFNKNLKMSFVHYVTCFSTGSNLAMINEALAKLNVNFIVSCQGITEQPTDVYNLHEASAATSFTLFFSTLCNFFNNSNRSVTSLRLGQDPIKTIVSTIVNPKEHALVRIPSIGIFSPLSVDKKVKILTNSIIKAHEFENKPIDCTNPDIEAIVVYSSYIGVPLKMNNSLPICSIALTLSQNFASLTKRKVCVFEEINYPDGMDRFMRSLTSLNKTYTPITFVIKKLQCLDRNQKPLLIEDMIFSIKGTRIFGAFEGDFGEEKTCIFSQNSNYYGGISSGIWDNISFAPIEKNIPQELISEVIDLQDMENIDLKNVTLPILVEQLEKKTSKEFTVQHPGSLQKILEQKIVENIN